MWNEVDGNASQTEDAAAAVEPAVSLPRVFLRLDEEQELFNWY